MTAAQVTTPNPAAALPDVRPVPLTRHVWVELRKLMDTRAGKWLLISIALVTAAAVVIFMIAGDASDLTFGNFIGFTVTPQAFLLPVLGILAITSEWSQRTGLTTFTLEPSRRRVLTAKLAAIVIIGLVFVGLAVAAAAVANVVSSSLLDGAGTWDFGWGDLGKLTLLQLLGLIQGVAFGMILLNSAAAIVLSFVLPTAFSILFNLISALQDAAPWIDIGTAQGPLFDDGSLTGNEWLHLLVTSLWWIVIPMAAGTIRVLRSEVK